MKLLWNNLLAIWRRPNKTTKALNLLNHKMDVIMLTMEDLTTYIEAQGTVIDGAATAFSNLSAQIADLKTHQTDPETAAKIDTLAAQVLEHNQRLSAAILANTTATA